MKSYSVTIQMKATEQYSPVVLFITLYKVVLTFESVDEIQWCDHLNESYWAVLSCGTVYHAVQGGSNFWGSGWNPMVSPFKWDPFGNCSAVLSFFFSLPESLDPWPSLFSPCLRLRKLLSELAHPGTFLRTSALVSTSEFWSQNRGT